MDFTKLPSSDYQNIKEKVRSGLEFSLLRAFLAKKERDAIIALKSCAPTEVGEMNKQISNLCLVDLPDEFLRYIDKLMKDATENENHV